MVSLMCFLQQEHRGWALSNGADTDYGTILQTWVTRGCQHLSSTCIILLMELGKDLLFFNIFPIIVNGWDSAPGHVWKMKNEEEDTWISAQNAKGECDCSYFHASERHILPLDRTRSYPEKKPADVIWWAKSIPKQQYLQWKTPIILMLSTLYQHSFLPKPEYLKYYKKFICL